jgi:hypothetical protein
MEPQPIYLFTSLSIHCSTALVDHGHICSLLTYTQSVGLLGRVISPSQDRYLHTGQHKHKINADTNIHVLNGIRTHDPSVRASEDSLCLSLRGHYDQPINGV